MIDLTKNEIRNLFDDSDELRLVLNGAKRTKTLT